MSKSNNHAGELAVICDSYSSTTLAGAYFLLFLTSMYLLARLHSVQRTWSHIKIVIAFITAVAFIRACTVGLIPVDCGSNPDASLMSESTPFFVAWAVPADFFMTAFIVLISYWANTFYTMVNVPISVTKIAISVIAVFYAGQIGVFMLIAFPSTKAMFLRAQPLYFGVFSLAAGGAYMVYGYRLYTLTRQRMWKGNARREISSKYLCTTVVVAVTFSIRGIVNLVWVNTVGTLTGVDAIVFTTVFYVIVEIIPLSVVLYICRKRPKRRSEEQNARLAWLINQGMNSSTTSCSSLNSQYD